MAFLGAGGLLLGHAVVMGARTFTNVTVPADLFAPIGHLLALVGLVGLYPVVNDSTPRLARIGAVAASIIAVGWAVVTLSILARTLRSQPSQIETLLNLFSISVLVSTVLPYVLFGVVMLRSDIASRSASLLLLSPAAMLVVLFVDIAILGVSSFDGMVIGAGLALSMLAIGYTLTRETQADRTSFDDVTPG